MRINIPCFKLIGFMSLCNDADKCVRYFINISVAHLTLLLSRLLRANNVTLENMRWITLVLIDLVKY